MYLLQVAQVFHVFYIVRFVFLLKIVIYSINYFNIELNLFLSSGFFELCLNLSKQMIFEWFWNDHSILFLIKRGTLLSSSL